MLKIRRILRNAGYTAGATGAIAASCIAFERMPGIIDPDSRLGNATSLITAAVRFTRSLRTAAFICADYRSLFARFSDYQSEEYRAARSVVHDRSAERLLKLARAQGAVYVKIGQHIASMNHTAPPEYTSKLKSLEDRAAYRPFWQIERSLSKQYAPYRLCDIFEDFEGIPVAAASLAQVHRARLRENGQRVAVKVQYPGLETLVRSDLKTIQILSWLLKWVFPFFNVDWLVEQFRSNLQKEVNFLLEARNAQRTASFFQDNKQVGVPHVHEKYSLERVLVMDYIDGCRIDDVDTLRKAGINTRNVALVIVDAFAQMTFLHGQLHCDPHPGNLLVRPSGKNGNFEVFLLDHGLYREFDDYFRHGYCKLWKGLVLRRSSDVEEACEQLGAKGLENLFSLMLLNRSWNSAKRFGTDIRMKMGPDELKTLRKELRESGLRSQADISSLAERIPDDLLLVFKMNSLVRNVNKALGASVNRFKMNARYAVRGLHYFNGRSNSEPLVKDKGKFTAASAGSENGLGWSFKRPVFAFCHWIGRVSDQLLVEIHLMALDVARLALRCWMIFVSRSQYDKTDLSVKQPSNINDLLG